MTYDEMSKFTHEELSCFSHLELSLEQTELIKTIVNNRIKEQKTSFYS